MAVLEPVAVPAARVVLRGLLVPFAVLAGYFVAWGVVFCMDALVRAFFGTVSGAVGWIPYAGRVITSPLHGIERKLTSFLGGLEAHFDRQMATRWHQLAELVSQYAANVEADAVFGWHLAKTISRVYGEAASGRLGKRFQAWVLNEIAHLHGVSRVVVRETKVIEKTVVQKGKAGALTVVRPTVAGLSHVIEVDLPRLRARDRALTDEVARLWRYARNRRAAIASGALLGAVAYALAKLGASWVRCSNVKRLGRRVCGMDNSLLDALLADTLAVVGAISILELAHELQRIMPEVTDVVRAGIRETQ